MTGKRDVSGAAAMRPRGQINWQRVLRTLSCAVCKGGLFGVCLRDQEDLNCFPMVWGCQAGVSFACGMAMRLGPKAAQFYSGFSHHDSHSSNKSIFPDWALAMCSALGSALTWVHTLSPHHQPEVKIMLVPMSFPESWYLNLLVAAVGLPC